MSYPPTASKGKHLCASHLAYTAHPGINELLIAHVAQMAYPGENFADELPAIAQVEKTCADELTAQTGKTRAV